MQSIAIGLLTTLGKPLILRLLRRTLEQAKPFVKESATEIDDVLLDSLIKALSEEEESENGKEQ